MNRKHFAAALPLIALLTVAATQQDGFLLRRTLKEGAQDAYRIDISGEVLAEIPGMGEQQMAIKGGLDYAIKFGKVVEDKADAEFLTSNISMTVDGPMADMMQGQGLPKDAKATGKIDARGKITHPGAGGISPELLMMAGPGLSFGQGIEFPEKPVKVGDSWEVIVPKGPVTSKADAKLSAKLIGESVIEGVPVYDLTLEGKVPLDIDLEELMKAMPDTGASSALAGMQLTMKGVMVVKTKGAFEKATGRALKLETTIDNDQTINIEGLNMSVKMGGKIKMVMALKK